ncbi:MAG: hypothetical protein KDC26_00190 [Armatimonadetes bacterium]|nr:hypothetical protein [Armatimonadota bacterium]
MRRAALTLALLAMTLPALAQISLPGGQKIPDIKLPSLGDLTKGEAPFVTNVNTIPFWGWEDFDKLQLKDFVELTNADRGEDNHYHLKPGRYQITLKTFCARGYTHGPTAGDGYIIGAWTGSKAQFLREIMRRYTAKGDSVDQKDVQLLVWAVMARVNPKDMKGGARKALLELMGDDGLKLMAQGALQHYADDAAKKIFAPADRAMRPFLEYENKMRGMFNDANRTYADFERVAMLEAPADYKTLIPNLRWNLHPKGYLVRFTSHGYSKSTMQIVIPNTPEVTRDEKSRVTRLVIGDYALNIGYDDSKPGIPYPDDKGLTAYAVNKIKIEVPEARGGVLEREVDGWIFKGKPTVRKKKDKALFLSVIFPEAASMLQFGGWRERYDQVQEVHDRIETYEEFYERTQRIERGERPDEDVFDSNHIQDLIDSLFGGTDDRLEQIGETHGRLAEWLAHATELIGGMGEDGVDPSDSPFAPGNPGGQTLLSSGIAY